VEVRNKGDFISVEELDSFGPWSSEALETLTREALPSLRDVARVFRDSILAVRVTLSLPLQIAAVGVQGARMEMFRTTGRIMRLVQKPQGVKLSESEEAEIEEEAMRKFRDEVAKRDKIDGHLGRASMVLEDVCAADGVFRDAAREIRYQACVMTWVALEVLAQDLFVSALNASPGLLARLRNDRDCKKKFDLDSIDMDVLLKYRFDVSKSIGDILIDRYSIDTMPAMKTVFGALCPDSKSLRILLDSRDLWLLSQRRNLIVHRRGVVDSRYVERTGEKSKPGDVVDVKFSEIDGCVRGAVNVGVGLVSAVDALLRGVK
jgi:hypothetical protein